jgi:hypothetical protein
MVQSARERAKIVNDVNLKKQKIKRLQTERQAVGEAPAYLNPITKLGYGG